MPRVTSDGRVTLPETVRGALGIEPGDEVTFVETDDGYVLRKAAPTTTDGADPFETYRGRADPEGSLADRMRRLRGVSHRPVDADGGDPGTETETEGDP